MRKYLLPFIFVLSTFTSRAQLVSYSLLDTFSLAQMVSIVDGFGASLFITPKYGIDLYKVVYLTPYKYKDSLVIATGAIAVPQNVGCPLPLAAYLHGTISDRTGVPSYQSQEATLGMVFASLGVMIAMPDYLGLGDGDSRVIIHPYVSAFHQGHTTVNILRSSRQLADSLETALNSQLFLTGYSQGGFSTVATHKLIEEEYSNEFTITASAPMSGPFDLKEAQVDLITSNTVYPTPGYLPYIILAYHSIDENLQQLYPDVRAIFKPPYDSLMPALFYSKNYDIGYINTRSTPVPKQMVKDSFVQAFLADSLHPFRVALAKSHLLDWAPQAPIKLLYCRGDDQVTYLNSERAYDSWTANGAPHVEKQDIGNFDHAGCVQFAVLAAKTYIEQFLEPCISGILDSKESEKLKVYPNPMEDYAIVELPFNPSKETLVLHIYDLSGKLITNIVTKEKLIVIKKENFPNGMYLLELNIDGQILYSKLIVNGQ